MPLTIKKISTTLKDAAAQKVWPILKDLIHIADAAGIPVCSGAFGALTCLIEAFDEVQDNEATYAELRATLGSYAKTLKDFVSVLPTAYLSCSNERHAVVARDAIKTFDRDLQHVRDLLQEQKKQNERNWVSQLAYRTKIKGDIEACKARLEQSHQAFRDAVSIVLAGNITQISTGAVLYDEWRITEAKCLPPHAVGLMKPGPDILKKWWDDNEDFVRAEVDGADRVVKLFRGKDREKELLQTLSGSQFQIYGYSAQANPPFIVFHSGTLVSFRRFLWNSMLDIVDKKSYYERLIRIWKCAIEVKEAAEFIITHHQHLIEKLPDPEGPYTDGAMVDASGSITMDVPNFTADLRSWSETVEMSDVLDALQWSLSYTLRDALTCRRFQQALEMTQESRQLVLSRKTFECARLDPYPVIRSLLDPLEFSINPWVQPLPWDDAMRWYSQLGDICLFDHRRASQTENAEFRKIGVIDGMKAYWKLVRPYIEPLKAVEVLDGACKFILVAPQHSELPWHMAIVFTAEVPQTDNLMSLLARGAQRLANEYSVMVDDIIIMTKEECYADFESTSTPSYVPQISEPIFFYVHPNERPPRCYWTLSNTPLTSQEVLNEKDTVDALGLPRPWAGRRVEGIQFDEWDIERYLGQDCVSKTVSDDLGPVPGGWDSAW